MRVRPLCLLPSLICLDRWFEFANDPTLGAGSHGVVCHKRFSDVIAFRAAERAESEVGRVRRNPDTHARLAGGTTGAITCAQESFER
jgi:hypothetical protein